MSKNVKEMGDSNQRLGVELRRSSEKQQPENSKVIETIKVTVKKANETTEERLTAI